MDDFSYLTVSGPSSGLYKEKGSKFISFVYPVSSEIEVKKHLEVLRKQYHDANHHCFAWILDPDKQRFRSSDDGEPKHSAGDPSLGQLKSRNLTNVLVVVVRYFGGTKLGVSGLIVAYRSAAQEALNKCTIVEKDVVQALNFKFDYANTPEVMRLVKEFDLSILNQDFQLTCLMKANVKVSLKEKLCDKIALLNATGSDIQMEFETKYACQKRQR